MLAPAHTSAPVLVVAHSEYGALRASQLVGDWPEAQVVGPSRGRREARQAVMAVIRRRPRVVYLIDTGASTAACAPVAKALGARVVLDTGDLAYELARSVGARSPLGLAAIWAGEHLTLALADRVVVRGAEHARHLRKRSITYAPDMAPPSARPGGGEEIRQRLGLEDAFVVGMVGSLDAAPRWGTVYGWDIVEALPQTPGRVSALIVGDGDGLAALTRRASALGVTQRCHFVGRVPPDEVAAWVSAMDVGISTQTNDSVGAVRTTGKLPLYLACGVPVLASDVGETRRLLGPLGWTLRYDGVVDPEYAGRLALAIARLAAESPEQAAERREQALALAAGHFDPHEVAARVRGALGEELDRARRRRR